RKIGSSSSKIFKLLLSLVAVSVLVAAVAVGIYLVRRNQDYREGAKGTPSYDLTAVVAYTKDDEIPEIARKTIERDNPLDYTIVLFQDSLGARFDLNQK